MQGNNLSFREYLETVEKALSFIGAMQDELGIDPEDVKKGTQVASFMKMGDIYNLSPFKIIGFVNDDDGNPVYAKCKIVNIPGMKTRKRWQKMGDKLARIDDAPEDDKVYLIPVGNLEDLMTKGMSGGAGMGGMGGMGGPGGII